MQQILSFIKFLLSMIVFSIFSIIMLATGVLITAFCLAWIGIPAVVVAFDLHPFWLLTDLPVLTICYIMYFSVKDLREESRNVDESNNTDVE